MKNTVAGLILAMTALSAAPVFGMTPHSPVLIQEDATQPQTVKAGEDFFIALPSNLTTGYAWSSTVADAKLIAYEGNVYQRASSGLPGAGGQQLFLFHANRSGATTISFVYARPFESNAAAAKTLTFNITVQ